MFQKLIKIILILFIFSSCGGKLRINGKVQFDDSFRLEIRK
ncbi:hypothetical protein [Persephonella sp.]